MLAPRPGRWMRLVPPASLAALQLGLSLHAASTIRTVATVDTASYYLVARSFAEGHGLTDPVVWQFLDPPRAAAHPAGDYWEVGWPLVLGALMRVFGTSQGAAIAICACLSALLPLAVFALALAVVRRASTAWLAGLLVCLQTRLAPPDVSPDVTLLYQLACLVGLAAALGARGPSSRGLLAIGAALGLPIAVRGEGVLAILAALPLLAGSGGAAKKARRAATALAGAGLVCAPFGARNLLCFGRLSPPSHELRLYLTRYNELFRFLSPPSPARFWSQPLGQLARVRLTAVTEHLDLLSRQAPWPLLVLAVLGSLVAAWRERRRLARAAVLPAFVVGSLLGPCLVAPIIANTGRFVMNVLPVLAVLAAVAVDGLARLVARRLGLGVAALAAAACVIAAIAVYRAPATMSTALGYLAAYRDTPRYIDPEALAPLHLAPDDVVMADDAWRVAAVLHVAAVRCPIDGDRAEDAVVERYAPRYLLADSATLARLAKRLGLRPVATLAGATWYAFP